MDGWMDGWVDGWIEIDMYIISGKKTTIKTLIYFSSYYLLCFSKIMAIFSVLSTLVKIHSYCKFDFHKSSNMSQYVSV